MAIKPSVREMPKWENAVRISSTLKWLASRRSTEALLNPVATHISSTDTALCNLLTRYLRKLATAANLPTLLDEVE